MKPGRGYKAIGDFFEGKERKVRAENEIAFGFAATYFCRLKSRCFSYPREKLEMGTKFIDGFHHCCV